MDDTERLIVALEGRFSKYEKDFERARRTTERQFQAIERRAARSSKNMETDMVRSSTRINQALASTGKAMGALAATMAAPIAAAGIVGLTAAVNSAARSIATIGDEAKRAGIEAREFQELQFVAEQNRIGVDSLTDGIKELNLRADEWITTGQGSGAEAFGRLGYTADELSRKLQKPSDLFLEIIGRLGRLDRAAQIRIADEIFGGTGGERFVQLIEQGEDALRDTIDEAHNLGIVMSDELISRADELDRKFNAIRTTVGTGLKRAIVEAASALGAFIDEFKRIEARTTENLRSRLSFAEKNLEAAQTRKEQGAGIFTGPLDMQIEKSQAEVNELRAELERRARAELRDGLIRQRNELANPIVPTTPPDNNSGGGGGSSRSGGGSTSGIERERDAVRELIAELEQELSLVHQSDQAKRAAEASRRAGASATDQERQQIIALNEAIFQEREALERAADAQRFAGDMAMDGVRDLTSAIDAGNQALDRMLGTLIEAVAQAALLGEGPLAALFSGGFGSSRDPWAGMRTVGGGGNSGGGIGSIIGGLLGGFLGLAEGGMVRGPGTSTSDSIPAMLSDGEFVVNSAATARHRALLQAINSGQPIAGFAAGGMVGSAPAITATASAPPIQIVNNVKVEGSAGTPEQNADLARQMAKQMEGTMRGVVADELRQQMRAGNSMGRR